MASREAMLAARDRRIVRFNARLQWYGERVAGNINVGMQARIKAATNLLRDKVVINISIPVVKEKSRRTRKIVVTERSQPGEFPRADTTRLMKDIYAEMRTDESTGTIVTGRVGTTLDYGLWLETRMQRSFLRRTFQEMAPDLALILASPGGGTAGPLPGQDG